MSALRGNELEGVTHKPKVRVIPGLPRLIANVLGPVRVSLIRSLAANSPMTYATLSFASEVVHASLRSARAT